MKCIFSAHAQAHSLAAAIHRLELSTQFPVHTHSLALSLVATRVHFPIFFFISCFCIIHYATTTPYVMRRHKSNCASAKEHNRNASRIKYWDEKIPPAKRPRLEWRTTIAFFIHFYENLWFGRANRMYWTCVSLHLPNRDNSFGKRNHSVRESTFLILFCCSFF